MSGDVVFLLDVNNTLLDNDRVSADLKAYLDDRFGRESGDLYWTILNQLRNELGYTDYLGGFNATGS